jgi:malic enzyme
MHDKLVTDEMLLTAAHAIAEQASLGSPVLTPEVQKKLINSVHAEAGSRSIDELAAERDEILLGLIELRNKVAKSECTDVVIEKSTDFQ